MFRQLMFVPFCYFTVGFINKLQLLFTLNSSLSIYRWSKIGSHPSYARKKQNKTNQTVWIEITVNCIIIKILNSYSQSDEQFDNDVPPVIPEAKIFDYPNLRKKKDKFSHSKARNLALNNWDISDYKKKYKWNNTPLTKSTSNYSYNYGMITDKNKRFFTRTIYRQSS